MRILLSIDTWGLVGGTERLAAAVATGLVERGHELTILCREKHAGAFPGLEKVPIVVLDFMGNDEFNPSQHKQLAASIDQAQPDVIFQHSSCRMAALGALLKLGPVVRFVHDHPPFCPGLNKFHSDGQVCTEALGVACITRYFSQGGCICLNRGQYRDRNLLAQFAAPFRALAKIYKEMAVNSRSAKLLTNSDYMAGELRQAGFAPELVERIWPFTLSNTSAQPAGPLPKDLQAFIDKDERPLVLCPARLTHPDKGVDYFLSAMGQVQSDFKLVIAGSGPAEPWLREKAQQDKLHEDRLFWAGWQASGAMETLLKLSSVVVCPSVWQEPFGLVGLEAMAHKKPIVAFPVGGIPEWLTNGETGISVPRCDTHAMAAAVDRLLGDPKLATQLGENGHAQIQARFSQAAHIDALEVALKQAAGRSVH